MIRFIVNPMSASGRGKKIWLQVEDTLKQKNLNYTVQFTNYPKHGISLAKEAVKDPTVQAIVAVGGDGTVHEAAQALIGTDIPLGFIPAGSGNDFARALDISIDSAKALERILQFRPFKIDIAKINNKYFVNGAGIGFDGAVAKMTNDSKMKIWLNRMKLGRFAYLASALRLLCTFRPTDLILTTDDRSHFFSNVWLIAVTNIPFYGGGMKVCPAAVYDDGLLDICIVRNVNRVQFLRSLSKVFYGKHATDPRIVFMKAQKIAVQSKDLLFVHTDGESDQSTPIQIKVEKQALNVL